ncbi:MAG: DUF1559 domain-containing protein, partial [Fuerstiella sp.]|nr:DUF1559 domain-containing protein [Fuerstiella sp.]
DDAAWFSPLGAVNSMRNPINNRKGAWLQGAGDRRCHSFSSRHVGGAQCLLADGSVRFATENIDHQIRFNLAVRMDGKSIGEW